MTRPSDSSAASELATVSPTPAPEHATLPPAANAESVTLPPASVTTASSDVDRVPGYEIIGELGRGGMGVVYKARQVGLNRLCALKMILAGGHAGEADLARFQTEAEAIARLQHPNIVAVYEVEQHEGKPFFSLESCAGGSLDRTLAGTPIDPKDAAKLLRTLAEAMQTAHAANVIHRDLKPANVLLSFSRDAESSERSARRSPEGALRSEDSASRLNGVVPKITDFGLAKKLDESSQTQTGAIMGTPSYMAPEQAEGKKQVGPAADVYALGAILYECLVGRPPFKAATSFDTIMQVVSDEPVPPRQLNAKVPADLETVCLKCLEKEPARRYGSAAELANDLGRFLAGEPIRARRVGRIERTAKWVRRNPMAAALVATLLLGTVVATSFAIRANQKAGEALEQKGRADEQKGRADKQVEVAKANARLANDRAYISDLRLVQRAWEENDIGLVHELLEGQRPEKTDGEDRRGFEWHYWWRISHSELCTIQAHTGTSGVTFVVDALAFSPDGRRLASCGGFGPGQVKIWDTATGQMLLTLGGHTQMVGDVAFSPDGRRLASGGGTVAPRRGEVKVWDAVTGKEMLTLGGHNSPVLSVAFSPDGRRLASASQDGTVKVWNAATGREERTLHMQGMVRRVVFSPDGRRLACAAPLAGTKVWDAVTWQEERTKRGPLLSLVTDVAFHPDGRCLAFGPAMGDGNTSAVKVSDAVTGQEVLTLKGHNGTVSRVIASPDGRRLASASGDGTVRVWDAATGQEYVTLRGHSGAVSAVAFSPDGRRLASGGTLQMPRKPAVGEIKVWDVGAGPECLTLRGHANFVTGVTFSPNGLRLASVSHDETVRVWEAATGRETLSLRVGLGLGLDGEVAFSPDGRRLASYEQRLNQPGAVKVWDAATGKVLHTLRGHTGEVFSVAFNPDGSRLASLGGQQHRSGEVKVWDAVNGQVIFNIPVPVSFGHGVAFSADGERLAGATGQALVKVWDVALRREVLTLTHSGIIHGVAFSPDGGRLAIASHDQTVRVWDLVSEREMVTLRGHSQSVLGVAFSPDGRRLASCGGEGVKKPGELKVWDAASGQEILTLRGHTMAVKRVAFSPDGRRLASASYDHTVRVWDATEETPESRKTRLADFEKPDAGWHLQEAKAAMLEIIQRGMKVWTPGVPLEHAKIAAGVRQDYAVQFHLKYLASAEGQRPPFYTSRGQLYVELGQNDKAVADFAQAIKLAPRDGTLWNNRAHAYVELKQLVQAEADLVKAVELAPEDQRVWHRLARVRLATGNATGYRTACAGLLQRFGKPTVFLPGEDVVWTCMLAPNSGVDPAQLLRLAEAALAQRPKGVGSFFTSRERDVLKTLGAVLYRTGKYDMAMQRLNEAIAAEGKGGQAIDWLFLAMAQHRLGRQDEASRSFAKAVSLMDEKSVAALTWEGRLEWDVVRKEAEALRQAKDR